MGFEDYIKQRRSGHHNDNGYYGGHGDEHHGHQKGIGQYLYLFEKLKNNKKLLVALSVAAIVIVFIVIAVIIMFIPMIFKLLGTIQKSGISGLIESARPLLESLWSGTGK